MNHNEAEYVLGRLIPEVQWQALVQFVALLAEGNTHFNLTSLRDRDAIYRRHVLESLALLGLLESIDVVSEGEQIIDVGSGGGIPGIPLAIVRPDARVVLIEATAKKAGFLRDTVANLGLANTVIEASRAEEIGHHPNFRESAALVTARAVAALDTLAELTLPLARVGGIVAAVKGSHLDDELPVAQAAVATCGGAVEAVLPLISPGSEPLRVVLMRKQTATPPPYPRRPGMPAKRPLR